MDWWHGAKRVFGFVDLPREGQGKKTIWYTLCLVAPTPPNGDLTARL